METVAKTIADYGVLLVIAAIFIYDWIKNKDKVNQTLEQNTKILSELSNTNSNISKTLDLLQESMDTQRELLVEHDRRFIEHIQVIETILKNK